MPFDHAEQSDPGVAQMDWGYLNLSWSTLGNNHRYICIKIAAEFYGAGR